MMTPHQNGITIGVRRGDLDLVKTCFDALWPSSWLLWRIPQLIIDDMWYLIGEGARLLDRVQTFAQDKQQAYIRSIYYKLAVAVKCRDPRSIVQLYSEVPIKLDHYRVDQEYQAGAYWLKQADQTSMSDAANMLLNDLSGRHTGLSDYEKGIAAYLAKKASEPGDYVERGACLTSMILLERRRIDQEKIKSFLDTRLAEYKATNGPKPKTIKLPDYCDEEYLTKVLDKSELSQVSRNHVKEHLIVGRLNKKDLRFVKRSWEAAPEPWDSVWLSVALEKLISKEEMSVYKGLKC